MPEKQITPERAIIILDSLNTDGRIEVDRDELRAAVKTAKEALRKQIKTEPSIDHECSCYECPSCFTPIDYRQYRCIGCGQLLYW